MIAQKVAKLYINQLLSAVKTIKSPNQPESTRIPINPGYQDPLCLSGYHLDVDYRLPLVPIGYAWWSAVGFLESK